MGLKMKNFNIMGVHQFLGEGGHKKGICRGNCLKRGLGQFPGGLAKKREEDVFEEEGRVDTPMHTMTQFWYMPELEIGLADVSQLNWSGFFLQYNAKKTINTKSFSQFEFKC